MPGLGVKYHQYIDDTQICFSLTVESGGSVEVMGSCLEIGWMKVNKLKFNPDKTGAAGYQQS